MSERSIFLAALDIANPAQRSAFLDQACGNEAALRKHIEELIAAEAKLGGFLARPHSAVDLTAAQGPVSERPGSQIGPYKLLEQIGEGGFGIVFMAEQQQPIRRKVALKILKPGMDTRQVIARFEAERQALALMDHPNIARVLDAGETSTGRPYFVMELVKGMPITQFCDEGQLTTRERLELFVTVCQAAQHAHQKGIIHRDIKPTNVLVTLHDGTPVAKVIDFGVAKATGYQLTEKTLFTGFAQMIGTPLYMSPEQAALSGLDIDTRSDIYSLGVLLYELLTGTTPLQSERLKQAAFDEVRRIIREEEAVKPSTRISTLGTTAMSISAQRKTEPHKLSQLLRNELDWIVMKALEKDRTRRYETASNLARDVQRYLKDEQVEACPPSLSYRISKFTRRNKVPLAVAAGFISLLIAGIAASSWQAVRAKHAEAVAVANERKALEAAEAATSAKDAEANQRRLAESSEQTAVRERNSTLAAKEELRETLYASEMNLVQAAWESRQYNRVAQLLDQQRPAAGQSDLRAFEWHYRQRKLLHGRLRSVEVPQLVSNNRIRSKTLNISHGGARLAAVLDYPGDSSMMQRFGLLAIFDGATGRELLTPFDPFPGWQDQGRGMRLLSMNSDGTRLAVAVAAPGGRLEDKQLDRISIRDGSTGSEIRSLESPEIVIEIALTPDGNRLAVVYGERATSGFVEQQGVKVWDTSTGKLVQTLPPLRYFQGFQNILWCPDGTRLLRQSSSREIIDNMPSPRQLIQIVDVASGEELWRRENSTFTRTQRPWSWSPDGRLLVVAEARDVAAKPNLQLWDSATRTTLAILDREVESPIRDNTIDFSPDGQRLAVVAGTNEIYVWEMPKLPLAASATPLRIATPNLTLKTAGEEIRGLAFSADSKTLHSVAGKSIVVWDATAREDTAVGPDPTTGLFSSSGLRSVAISADTTKVAFSGNDSRQDFSVWDLARDQEVTRLETDGAYSAFPPVFSPDRRRVAVVRNVNAPQNESQVVFYDAQTGEALDAIHAEESDPSSLVYFSMPLFRPDGGQIAAVITPGLRAENRGPRRLMAWDGAAHKPAFSVNLGDSSERRSIYLLGYSPDGASLVVGHYDFTKQREGAVVFYDAATGKQQRSIPVPSSLRPGWIDFSSQTIGTFGRPDVAVTRSPTTAGRADVVLFDLATGQERLRLRGHDGFDQFAVSRDGSRLALGKLPPSPSGESELTLWSLKSGRQLLTLKRQGSVEALSFSPDGNRLVAAFAHSNTGTSKPIQIYDATPLPEEIVK